MNFVRSLALLALPLSLAIGMEAQAQQVKDPAELTRQVARAYETTEGVGLSPSWGRDVYYLPNRNYRRHRQQHWPGA